VKAQAGGSGWPTNGSRKRLPHKFACYDVLVKIAVFALLFPLLCGAANTDCAPCHAKIVDSFSKTGMGRSFYKPDAVIAGTYYHAASDTHFQMLQRGGKYYQRRYQLDSAGKEINVDEKQIDFVMGSGNHVRTYLHRAKDGAFQQLPLAWYSERGGYWGMNPGYDTPIQPNSRRKIGYDCMYCHNAYPEIPAGHDQLRAEPVFIGSIPEGIDCQRCHGAGVRHIEFAKSPRPKIGAIRESIVNPSRLPADRQMEVCAQCHLETDSFPFPHSILKYDRAPFSYRPGEPLANFILSFDHSLPDDRFQIVNSVYRLRKSACFLKSNDALRCTTCHDPHISNSSAEHYNGVCRACHANLGVEVASRRHTASPDCIACHMPKRRTDDVVHAVMTDHYIQRRKPDRDLLDEIPEPHGPEIIFKGEVVPYALSPLPRTPDAELYLALAQVREENNLTRGLEQFANALQKYRPPQAEFYIELADAYVKAGQPDRAVPLYKEALRKKPDSLAAALGLGVAQEKSGDIANAVATFRQATQFAPGDASSWRHLGEAQLKLGALGEAAASLGKLLDLDPEVPEAHYALAMIRSADPSAKGTGGQGAGAESSYREAIRLQPDYSAAHMNLAILLFGRNQAAEARDHFESALRSHPEYALGHYNFGLMLIAQKRLDEARRQLELAVLPNSSLDAKSRADALRRLSDLRGRR
jgi:tetratricopeptide (TPR) repeat protein